MRLNTVFHQNELFIVMSSVIHAFITSPSDVRIRLSSFGAVMWCSFMEQFCVLLTRLSTMFDTNNNNDNNNNNKYIYKAQKTKGFYALYMVKHNVQYKIDTFI